MFRDEWIRAIESVSERLQVLEGQDEPMDQDDDSMAVSFGKRKKIVRLVTLIRDIAVPCLLCATRT